jgi:agmatinase
MDVVEVAPAYDHAEITALLANRVVLEALSGIAARRKALKEGKTINHARPLLEGR